MEEQRCGICGKVIVKEPDSVGTGYGVDDKLNLICYVCCADKDREFMREHGQMALYLGKGEITNWPGTLRLKVTEQKEGKHNLTGRRVDAWFVFEGEVWHGVLYGNSTQIIHCKRTKERVVEWRPDPVYEAGQAYASGYYD